MKYQKSVYQDLRAAVYVSSTYILDGPRTEVGDFYCTWEGEIGGRVVNMGGIEIDEAEDGGMRLAVIHCNKWFAIVAAFVVRGNGAQMLCVRSRVNETVFRIF